MTFWNSIQVKCSLQISIVYKNDVYDKLCKYQRWVLDKCHIHIYSHSDITKGDQHFIWLYIIVWAVLPAKNNFKALNARYLFRLSKSKIYTQQ